MSHLSFGIEELITTYDLEIVYLINKDLEVVQHLKQREIKTKKVFYSSQAEAMDAARGILKRRRIESLPPWGWAQKVHYNIRSILSSSSRVEIENYKKNRDDCLLELEGIASGEYHIEYHTLNPYLKLHCNLANGVILKNKELFFLRADEALETGKLTLEKEKIAYSKVLISKDNELILISELSNGIKLSIDSESPLLIPGAMIFINPDEAYSYAEKINMEIIKRE